jgi:hypothetical protein
MRVAASFAAPADGVEVLHSTADALLLLRTLPLQMQAVNVASINPTGGQQSTQSAAITVYFTVLC